MANDTPKIEELELTEEELKESLADFRDDNDRIPEAKELACHATGEDDPTEEQIAAAQAVLDGMNLEPGSDDDDDEDEEELDAEAEYLQKLTDEGMVVIPLPNLLRAFGSNTDWSPAPEVFTAMAELIDSHVKPMGYENWQDAYRFMANNNWELEDRGQES